MQHDSHVRLRHYVLFEPKPGRFTPVYRRMTVTWKTYDGRELELRDMDDAHLANAIKWVSDRLDSYRAHVLDELAGEVARRDLPRAFLERAEIPWKDSDGDWCLDCRKLAR